METKEYYDDDVVEVYEVGREHELNSEHFKSKTVEYSVGEICKCYYNVIEKCGGDSSVIQTQRKCQGYCKVIERNQDIQREYTVEVFNPIKDKIKKLPGCCLRKVRIEPYGLDDAVNLIGQVVMTKDGTEYMEIVSVCENGGYVRINDIDSKVLMDEYVHTCPRGYPCGRLVMMKADEVFGDDYPYKHAKGETVRHNEKI